jgi:hypothetical protein
MTDEIPLLKRQIETQLDEYEIGKLRLGHIWV